ncbi:hypothetical protein Tco_1022313 [Tanacetum coccineum]
MTEKINDPIAVANKQNCWTINYKKLNALYKDFVPQKELSVEQKYFSSSSIPSVKIPVSKNMPSESHLIKELDKIKVCFEKLTLIIQKNCKRTSIFYTSLAEIQINHFCQDQVKPILNEMKEDIKNLVITSCVEIRNKNLHDEIDRISKESKDVSNESKINDTVCNDAFGVTQELSKRIIDLEKDLSKFEAKSIAFEIALQHKSRENNSLKTVQKENENFMASLQLENAHLKQTYKDLFESVQRSKVETNQCDEVKVKDNFDEIETKNIELEYQVASLIKDIEHLKLTYKNLFDSIKKSQVQTKTSNVTQNEAEILKSQLFEFAETKFSKILEKIEFFKKSPGKKQHLFENKTSVFQIKIDELEKVDDSKAEKDQFLKEMNHLRTQLENLKGKSVETKFDKSSKPRESVSAKVHTGESSKPFSRRVSQFTTYSLQKDRKFSKNSQSFETLTPQNGFKKRASNAKHQSFETTYSCFTPVKQVWRPIKESQTFEASTFQKSFKTSSLKGNNQVFVTPHARFTPVKQVWRPMQSHLKYFKYSKSEMLSMQNKNDLALKNKNNERFSNASNTNFQNDTSNGNNKWKFSSPTRFKTPHETPSFKNQWKIKRNFKSPLIPRELFSNETPVTSHRWNSTSLHRLETTFNWFSNLVKPVCTVLKWVPKVVV